MSSLEKAFVILAFMLVGMFLGVFLRKRLPEHHTKDDSKDLMKSAAGMLATLVALIIGLLVSSAKSSFDSANANITQGGVKLIALNHVLSKYGPEADGIRELMKKTVAAGNERIWPTDGKTAIDVVGMEAATGMDDVYEKVRELTPKNESQQYLKSQALQLSYDLMQSRWMVIEQSQNTLPILFLVVLVFWLTALFLCFGLMAPRNVTALSALALCAFSMAGAVYLIMELNRPLEGTIKVSNAPLVKALAIIGK